MRKVCPQCQGAFEAQFLCPSCGVQLLDEPDRSAVIATAAGDDRLRADRVGRQLVAGLVFAAGLYFAARQAAAGLVLLGVLPEAGNVFILLGLQAVAAVGGGLVAGAGNPRGLAGGTAVGVLSAVLLAGTQVALAGMPSDTFLLWVWPPVVVAGAAGGFFGRRLWPSIYDLPDPNAKSKDKTTGPAVAAPPVPIAYLRIMGGAALAIGCTVWAGRLRDTVISMGGGAFSLDSPIQSQFIAWAITTLAMMVGGAFAGAGMRGGVRHGFLVGLVSCIGIFVVHQEVVKEVLPAEQFFAAVFHLPQEGEPSAAQTTLFLLSNTLLIGVASGWFGSKLLPKMGDRRGDLDRGAI